MLEYPLSALLNEFFANSPTAGEAGGYVSSVDRWGWGYSPQRAPLWSLAAHLSIPQVKYNFTHKQNVNELG